MTVRPATKADIDQIIEVFLACWRETYAAALPQRLVGAMSDRRARDLWMRASRQAASGELLVAVAQQPTRVVGVTRLDHGVDGTGHIGSLYVTPRAQGLGVGRTLLEAATDSMARSGVTTATLWVFRDNAPSIAFYRHLGWLPDGEHRTQAAFGEPEIRMSRPVRPSDAGGA